MGMKRDEYVSKLKSQLDQWNSRLDTLERRAQEVGDEARDEVRKRMAHLRERRSDVEKQLKKVQSTGENAWEAMKDGMDRAIEEFRKAFQETESYTEKHMEHHVRGTAEATK